jgi:DNA polymerase-3 subunit delta'
MYSFSEIKGNFQLIKNLKSALKNGRISHAYMICGDAGSGKKLVAKTFAKAILCENSNGCGHCLSCRTFESENNIDVFYPKPEKTKSFSVDDIREQVVESVAVKPYKYNHKIYIIDNADTMTVAAQNAFLKTLEEPPEYAVFILLAKNSNIFLTTVLSRCVVFNINPLDRATVSEYMKENFGVGNDEAMFLAEYSKGSIGKAVQLKNDENFYNMREFITERLFNIRKSNLADVVGWGKEIKSEFGSNDEIFDIIYLWFRDVLAAKVLGDKKYIIEKDKADKIYIQAQNESCENIHKALLAAWEGKKLVSRNVSFQQATENALMKIKES